jgi:crotonobetainyl-CoA:carnitine CoA-transferase CaiB-like acyl-CoA transferase
MLGHLKILDLTGELGAYAGRLLAALGAQVVRVEPLGGDSERQDGVAYAAAHAGKSCVALDSSAHAGRAAFRALLDAADVVLEEAGALAAWGFADAALEASHPALVVVHVLPHGTGERLDLAPASDLTIMAMSGIMHIVGDPDRPPLKLPGTQAAALAGTQAAIAALMAVNARAADGQGQRIEVSAYQSAVLAGYRDPIVWEWTGRLGQRTGNRLVRGKSGVRQIWACQDGYVTWSLVDNPPMMRGMTALMQEHGAGERLAAMDWGRTLMADADQEVIDRLEEETAAFFLRFTRATLAAWSAAKGLGLSPIATPADALAEPHWEARNFWRTAEADGVTLTLPGPPFVTDAPLPASFAPLTLAETASFSS